MLEIINLKVNSEEKEILKGVNLSLEPGSLNVLMGKNGSGKSTLAQSIMGSPFYKNISGKIIFEGEDLTNETPDVRSQKGIFLSFQYPSEVEGVSVISFLRLIYNKRHHTNLSPRKFREVVSEKIKILNLSPQFLERYLNEGFSGGEKKRMEMLQMLVLEPNLAILDEVDSGLDVDGFNDISNAVSFLQKNNHTTFLIITHGTRILHKITPSKVFVMKDGQIVTTGDSSLAYEIEKNGYEKH